MTADVFELTHSETATVISANISTSTAYFQNSLVTVQHQQPHTRLSDLCKKANGLILTWPNPSNVCTSLSSECNPHLISCAFLATSKIVPSLLRGECKTPSHTCLSKGAHPMKAHLCLHTSRTPESPRKPGPHGFVASAPSLVLKQASTVSASYLLTVFFPLPSGGSSATKK